MGIRKGSKGGKASISSRYAARGRTYRAPAPQQSAYQKAIAKKQAKARAPPPPPRSVSKAAMDAKRRSEGQSRAAASRAARKQGAINRKAMAGYSKMTPAQQVALRARLYKQQTDAREIAAAKAKTAANLAYQRAFDKESKRFAAGLEAQRAWAKKTSQTTAQSRKSTTGVGFTGGPCTSLVGFLTLKDPPAIKGTETVCCTGVTPTPATTGVGDEVCII